MRIAVIVLTTLLFAGCKENGQAPAASKDAAVLRWAVVDRRDIEEALITAAREQNPLPVEFREGEAASTSEQEVIAEQLERLESAARSRCMTEELKAIVDRGQSVACEHMRSPSCDRLFDQTCLANIPNDPQIAELKKRRVSSADKKRKQERYRGAIRALAKEKAKTVIADYAATRFDLVIEKSNDPVVYARNGMVTDVTEGIIEEIRKNPLNLKMTDDQLWAKSERSY